jgi:hypothetical protein
VRMGEFISVPSSMAKYRQDVYHEHAEFISFR